MIIRIDRNAVRAQLGIPPVPTRRERYARFIVDAVLVIGSFGLAVLSLN